MPLVFFRYDHETERDTGPRAARTSSGGDDRGPERQLEVEGQRSGR
jgi:hypothetical protein